MRLQSQEVSLVRSKLDIREILQKNAVTVMFVVLCIIGLICSGQTVSYVMYELFGRLSRNAFIVLALIIPIVAGMGINFAITIGSPDRSFVGDRMGHQRTNRIPGCHAYDHAYCSVFWLSYR